MADFYAQARALCFFRATSLRRDFWDLFFWFYMGLIGVYEVFRAYIRFRGL